MSRIDKEELRQRMLALEEAELKAAREHYESYLADSRMATNEPHERDEMAAARTAADLAHGFDHPIHDHEAKISALEAMDFSARDVAEPGAVVEFGGKAFVLAVATGAFEAGGMRYMGISLDSPIAQALSGLAAGERFGFNGREIEIDAVW